KPPRPSPPKTPTVALQTAGAIITPPISSHPFTTADPTIAPYTTVNTTTTYNHHSHSPRHCTTTTYNTIVALSLKEEHATNQPHRVTTKH
ncbi:Hypothetical predicted protein, partial [Olea europaea subsp. europaea]